MDSSYIEQQCGSDAVNGMNMLHVSDLIEDAFHQWNCSKIYPNSYLEGGMITSITSPKSTEGTATAHKADDTTSTTSIPTTTSAAMTTTTSKAMKQHKSDFEIILMLLFGFIAKAI